MSVRGTPFLLFLVGCGPEQTEKPEIAFRQCIQEKARALKINVPPAYAVAVKFAENCSKHLKSLPRDEQQQLSREYICALSRDLNHCPAVY